MTINGVTFSNKQTTAEIADLGALAATKTITDATNATPIVITSNAHGYSNGNVIFQTAVGGNTAANGFFKVANKTNNTYELTNLDGTNVPGNADYTSGGTAQVFSAGASVVSDVDGHVTRIYVDNSTGGALTVSVLAGNGVFLWKVLSIAAASDKNLYFDVPQFCSGGIAIYASATGVKATVEFWPKQNHWYTAASGFSQPS